MTDSGPVETFELPVRVYYENTDAGGLVYHSDYLNFLERGRTEWLRKLGFEQHALVGEHGIVFAVRRLQIEYLAPARLDDALVVETAIEKAGRVSMHFRQRIRRDEDRVLVDATVQVACIDAVQLKPTAIPRQLREAL
jgi:acyl-CoA thioester hydrolase